MNWKTVIGAMTLGAISASLAGESVTIQPRRVAAAPVGGAAKRSGQPEPLLAGKRLAPTPLARLEEAGSAAAADLDALEQANVSGGRPWQVGFARSLSDARSPRAFTLADFAAEAIGSGGSSWTGLYEVAGAYLTRAHLEKVVLPAGTLIWTYGEDGIPQGPVGAAQLSVDGDLWLPSVAGEKVWIEIQMPAAAPSIAATLPSTRLSLEGPPGVNAAQAREPRFEFSEVTEIFRLDTSGRPLRFSSAPANSMLPCLVDISCVTPMADITNASGGVGSYTYVHKKKTYVCTGGLLNDAGGSGQEYFLTANHCLGKSKDAASMETWWDYRSSACDGIGPAPGAVQKSFGGTLLATSAMSDFTFVRVNGVPSARFFFGSTTAGTGGGTVGRVSNPGGGLQVFSETYDNGGAGGTCSGLPASDFLYQTQVSGAIAGGSSGAPSWIAGGFVVGQLFGLCGAHPNDDCDASNSVVDGRFSQTFNTISPWLTDPTGTPSAPVNLSAAKLSKKKVTLLWSDTSAIEERYDILSFGGASWTTIGTLPMNATSVKVKGLQGGQMYTLGVSACLGSACSAIQQIIVLTP